MLLKILQFIKRIRVGFTSLSARTNTTNGYSLVEETFQTRNSGEIIKVHGVLDNTEGLVPFDMFFDNTQQGSRNLDVGGGQYDTATEHMEKFYGVTNLVYDPYNRTKNHNESVVQEVSNHPVDTATSFSILNVILNEQDRKNHIGFIFNSLKADGQAFFTIWRGNGTGIPSDSQSNRDARSYLAEVAGIFGHANAYSPNDDIGNTIVAKKSVDNASCATHSAIIAPVIDVTPGAATGLSKGGYNFFASGEKPSTVLAIGANRSQP